MLPWAIDFVGRVEEPAASLAMPLGGRGGFAATAG
jgi:hypothetical protein